MPVSGVAPSTSAIPDQEDAQLIAAFLDGDHAAVSQVRAWLLQASRSYRSRLASWDDAQQELLLEVTRLFRHGSFRGEARLKTYLWRVVNHTCLNLLRAQARVRVAHLDDWTDRFEAARTSVLDALLSSEAVHNAACLVNAMRPECRQLWKLILRGLSYREMSLRLGVAEGALRVRTYRCRKEAADLWAEWKR